MKKSILTLVLSLLLMAGCGESQMQKANAKKAVKRVLAKLQAAYAKEDVDAILDMYSEDFEGGNGEVKEQVAQLLNGMKEQGYLTDTELDLDDVKLKVEGDTVTAVPLKYTGSWGEVEYKTTFKKEGFTWKMIGAEEYFGE